LGNVQLIPAGTLLGGQGQQLIQQGTNAQQLFQAIQGSPLVTGFSKFA